MKKIQNDPILHIKRSEFIKKLSESYQNGYDSCKNDAVGHVLAMLLGLPCKVLHDHYGWGIKKRLPEFGELVLEEYQNFDGTIEEMQEYIFQTTGIKFVQDE